MQVLFTSTAGVGHVTPMLPLARAFADRGDEVRWAVQPAAVERLTALGFDVTAVGDGFMLHPSDVARQQAEALAGLQPHEKPNFLFAEIFGYERTRRMLPDMLGVVDAWRPDLVIREAAEFSAPIAAAEHGVPYLTHAFGALLPEPRVARAGAAVAPLWEERGLTPAAYGGSYDHLYLDIYPPLMQPQDRPHVSATRHIRPAAVSSGDHVATDGRPLVYVTFGTVFNATEPLATVVAGVRELDVDVLVTVGPQGDVAALGSQPRNVRVESFVPQDEVLPRAAAVVSHAGSGTFLGAAAAGVPQVCIPQGADQYLNAEACARSGIGLVLPGSPTADEVRDAVERVSSEPAYAEAAQAVRREIAAMPTPGNVAAELAQTWGRTSES
jgi:UDP:flavonoid glycosyltransferase YjiC (YdhE family)